MRLTTKKPSTPSANCACPANAPKDSLALPVSGKGKRVTMRVAANLGFDDAQRREMTRTGMEKMIGDGNLRYPLQSYVNDGAFNVTPPIKFSGDAMGRGLHFRPHLYADREIMMIPWARTVVLGTADGSIYDEGAWWEWWWAPLAVWRLNRNSKLVMEIIQEVNRVKGRALNWTPEGQAQADEAARVKAEQDQRRREAEAALAAEDAKRKKAEAEFQASGRGAQIPGGTGNVLSRGRLKYDFTPDPNWKPDVWTPLTVISRGVKVGENYLKGNTAPGLGDPSSFLFFRARNGKEVPLELFKAEGGSWPIWGIEGEEGILAASFRYLGPRVRDGSSVMSVRVSLVEAENGRVTDYIARIIDE